MLLATLTRSIQAMKKANTTYKSPEYSDNKKSIIAKAIEIFKDQDEDLTITIETIVRKPLQSKNYSITQKESCQTPISSYPAKIIVTYEGEETKHERKEVVDYMKQKIRKLLGKK